MKHSRRPGCVRRSAARCARQGALHNRRSAGLRERVRAAAYAVVVCRMLYAVAVLLRGGTGLRNEKTFSSFAEAFGDSAKLFCVRLRLPARRGARLFRPEARRIRDFAVSPDWRGERTAVGTGRSAFVLTCAGGTCGYALIGSITPTVGAVCAGCCFGARARKDVFIGRGAAGKSQKRTARS